MNSSILDYRMREVLEKITLGVVKSLENQVGVTDVKMMDQKPTEQHLIDMWEKKYTCKLPTEIQNFYHTTDGMLIQWSIKSQGRILPLGRMEINPIASLTKLTYSKTSVTDDEPSLNDIDSDNDEMDTEGKTKPHFDERNRIFELDSCGGAGKVCLVYKDVKAGFTVCRPEIWFLDRALQWFYLSDNFINYFRMMMIHLGLPCWQYLFTDCGLSPETKCWFNLYAPDRLAERTMMAKQLDSKEADLNIPGNKIDSQRIFKGKSEKKKITNEPSKGKSQGNVAKSKPSNYRQYKNITRSPQR